MSAAAAKKSVKFYVISNTVCYLPQAEHIYKDSKTEYDTLEGALYAAVTGIDYITERHVMRGRKMLYKVRGVRGSKTDIILTKCDIGAQAHVIVDDLIAEENLVPEFKEPDVNAGVPANYCGSLD